MLEKLKILILGYQPTPNISKKNIETIIQRDYGNCIFEVKELLNLIKSDSEKGHNRIVAAVLKSAKGDVENIRKYVTIAQSDFRDVIAEAEYPLSSKYSSLSMSKRELRSLYLADWINYNKWLREVM